MRALPLSLLPLVVFGMACTSSTASSDATTASEINGGLPARNSPAVGLLVSSDDSLCTGTLVAPRWVLTAAHCVGEITDFYTGSGAAVRDDESLDRALATMVRHPTKTAGISHPSYVYDPYACPARGADVAIVELETPIDDIEPVAIEPLPAGGPVWCQPIGFGKHGTPEGATIGEKRYTTESVTSITEDVIATQRGQGNWLYGMSAPGDSGGPLFCHMTATEGGFAPPPPSGEPRRGLVGVTSCGNTPTEGVYALVGPVMDWISDVTRGDVR